MNKPEFELSNVSVAQFFKKNLAKHDPDSIALIDPFEMKSLSVSDVNHRSESIAIGFIQIGVTPYPNVILFYADNSIQCVITIYGIIYLGASLSITVPSDVVSNLANKIVTDQCSILAISGHKISIVQKLFDNKQLYSDAISCLKTIVIIDSTGGEDVLASLTRKQVVNYETLLHAGMGCKLKSIPYYSFNNFPNDKLLIMNTINEQKRKIVNNQTFLRILMNETEDSVGKRIIVSYPIGHLFGLSSIYSILLNGMILIPTREINTEHILQLVERFRVQWLMVTYQILVEMGKIDFRSKYDLSSLEIIKFGGNVCDTILQQKIKNLYNVQTLHFSDKY